MWGWFIVVFAGVWMLQIMLTKIQLKNYQATIKAMSKRDSGFLGVGMQKQKLGIGAIAILVTDQEGVVIESRMMKGVTVFSRFEQFTDYDGLHLDKVKENLDPEKGGLAVKMAIEKIEAQMEKNINLAV